MKKNIIYLLAAFGLGAMLFGCSSSDKQEVAENNEGERRTEPVRVMVLDYQEISRTLNYTANLKPYREVYLAPAAPGRIDKIHVEVGNRVGEGQLLVEMDKTQLQQARIQLQSIETDFRRVDTLRRVGSISQQQYDQIHTQYNLAKSSLAFLQENTQLLAPFAGVVSDKYFENGEMFSGAPNTVAGKAAILSLVQTNRLKAVVNIPERFIPHIKVGMSVAISSDLHLNELFEATIQRIYPTIDPATRSFRIELSIPNPSEKLKPGMFAKASIEIDQVNAFVVPALAVMKLQGSNERFVFLEKNGKAHRVVVELGDRYDDLVELLSNEIKVGDRLVVAGQSRLLEGLEVSIVQ
jgi:membrane fusion protein, multidrug efflux system